MYKSTHSFDERKNECDKLSISHPDRICVIVEPGKNEETLLPLTKKKFLIHKDLSFIEFKYIIVKQLTLNKSIAVYFYASDNIINSSTTMGVIHNEYRDDDGMLYINYVSENTFG
jgi:GABA(A) receptor-associated protein